ncbi:MAG: hypothetical protein P4K98_12240 [Bryobacteraceae bacterium]|nr:hypothetical protein [Bryobacteraceae bacterium]
MPRAALFDLRLLAVCGWAFCLQAFGATETRPSPNDYPVQCSTPEFTLAGEYYGRSAPAGASTIFTGYYLVVEAAVYPAHGHMVAVNPSELRLFINGARIGLLPQSSSVVAGTLKQYGYEHGVSLDTGVGPIFIPGRPRQGPNFPGDPTDREPSRPKAPGPGDDPNGKPQSGATVPDDPAEALPALALEGGETTRPVSGYLYFFWQAHTKKIRSMELRWEPFFGEPPKAVLKLVSRPR